jgi:hypothetical protein
LRHLNNRRGSPGGFTIGKSAMLHHPIGLGSRDGRRGDDGLDSQPVQSNYQ